MISKSKIIDRNFWPIGNTVGRSYGSSSGGGGGGRSHVGGGDGGRRGS